jgi:glycosyltransferase involved in cell wall biosynthesis
VPVGIKKKSATYLLFYLSLFVLLPFYLVSNKPQVVYTRHQQLEWLATCWKWLFKFSYVIESNGLAPVELKMNSAPGWWIKIVKWMEWFCFRMPGLIVTSSHQLRDVMCDSYNLNPNKFLVVSNGANPDIFKPLDLKSCREKLQMDLNGIYLIFIGSLRKWHGLDQIILAMVQLKERFPDMYLLLVGDGEERCKVERLISKNQLEGRVLMVGEKPFREIPDYINASDICLGSFIEKPGISPLKVFEYMACAKPLICNSVGGLDALFNRHKVGTLIISQDPGEWVESISEMLNHPERMTEYGGNGLVAVKEEFNWEAICNKIETALERLVSSK